MIFQDKKKYRDFIIIPRTSHRLVIGINGTQLRQIEQRQGVVVEFPRRKSGSEFVYILGDDRNQIEGAKTELDVIIKIL